MFRRRPTNRKHHYTGDVFKILYQNRAERPEDLCSVLQEPDGLADSSMPTHWPLGKHFQIIEG